MVMRIIGSLVSSVAATMLARMAMAPNRDQIASLNAIGTMFGVGGKSMALVPLM